MQLYGVITSLVDVMQCHCLLHRLRYPDEEVVVACVLSALGGGDVEAAVERERVQLFPLPDTGIALHQNLEAAKVVYGPLILPLGALKWRRYMETCMFLCFHVLIACFSV